jgi:hypothetical protein
VLVPHPELTADDDVGSDALGLIGLRQRLAGAHRLRARVPRFTTGEQHDVAFAGEDVEHGLPEQAARQLTAILRDTRLHMVETEARGDERSGIAVPARRRAHDPHAVGGGEQRRSPRVALGAPEGFDHHVDGQVARAETEMVVVGTERELADADDDRRAGIEGHGRSE